MKTNLFLFLLWIFLVAAPIYAQRPQPQRLPPFLTDQTGKEVKRASFSVERYYYIVARSINPTATAKVIRLLGHVGGVDASAYLTFSDREADKAPSFEDASYTVYINYPESMLPDIERILSNPGRVLCQIYFIDKDTVWASVESPVIERK